MVQQQTAQKPEYRIGMVVAGLMVITAFILDALQVLLTLTGVFAIASELVTFIGEGMFALWFFLQGVGYFSGKKAGVKLAAAFTTTVVELVPLVDALPALTLGVISVIWASRAEDRLAVPKVQ